MDLELSVREKELVKRGRDFCDQMLIQTAMSAIGWNPNQFFRDADTIKAKTGLTEDQLKAMPEETSDDGVWHAK